MSTNKSRIFVTSDTHGDYDLHKLSSKAFPIGKTLTKNDYVIVCGDFGAIWDGGKSDAYLQKWYASKPWTTLFVDGNHENHNLINSYPVEEWNGGKVHKINDSIIHLMRGQVYDINGKTFFTFGGAESVDRCYRRENISWWANEMPSNAEYEEGIKNLERVNWQVDYIITHDSDMEDIENLGYWYTISGNALNRYLWHLKHTFYLQYRHHYFGHHHLDKVVGVKDRCVYNDVIELTEDNNNERE